MNIELYPLLSTIIHAVTIITIIFAFFSYLAYRARERRAAQTRSGRPAIAARPRPELVDSTTHRILQTAVDSGLRKDPSESSAAARQGHSGSGDWNGAAPSRQPRLPAEAAAPQRVFTVYHPPQ
jgi:hypothetical protein